MAQADLDITSEPLPRPRPLSAGREIIRTIREHILDFSAIAFIMLAAQIGGQFIASSLEGRLADRCAHSMRGALQ